jgi:signal transduction histidine kinase
MVHTLRFRLLMVMILVIITAVGVIAFFGTMATTMMFNRYEEDTEPFRPWRYELVLIQHYAQHGNWSDVQPVIEYIGQTTGKPIVLADGAGQVVADSTGELIGQPLPPGPEWQAPASQLVYDGQVVGAIYSDLPGWGTGPWSEGLLASINRALLLSAGLAGFGATLLILGLSRRILAPIEALTAAAQRLEAGDLSQRVEITSHDEIGDLAHAFNAMADGLARLEELRRNLVGDVAHELRTPLSNIRGYLEAIQDGVVEPGPDIVDSLYEEAMLLHRLVDDLQELALAEAGQLRLERRPVALADVVDRAVGAVHPRAEAGGITLRVDVADDLPLVDVDPQRIGQVLRNLLDNALAHTPASGEIVVAASLAEHWIEVRVRDTGVGIAPEDLPYVFERFYRADRSRARATGGTGLGLAIARHWVEAHGGEIRVESAVGQGTCFTLTLPVANI